jgi:hypothetical protein
MDRVVVVPYASISTVLEKGRITAEAFAEMICWPLEMQDVRHLCERLVALVSKDIDHPTLASPDTPVSDSQTLSQPLLDFERFVMLSSLLGERVPASDKSQRTL